MITPNKNRVPNGGFEITIKAAVFLFENWIAEGVLKSPFFKHMAVSRRYRYVLFCLL